MTHTNIHSSKGKTRKSNNQHEVSPTITTKRTFQLKIVIHDTFLSQDTSSSEKQHTGCDEHDHEPCKGTGVMSNILNVLECGCNGNSGKNCTGGISPTGKVRSFPPIASVVARSSGPVSTLPTTSRHHLHHRTSVSERPRTLVLLRSVMATSGNSMSMSRDKSSTGTSDPFQMVR